MIKTFSDIEAYQRSKTQYPKSVELSKKFPPEGFHLRDQLCRSANSIHSNIAEGFGRSVKEFKMYLTRSLGSCNETISHLEDAINAKFSSRNDTEKFIAEYTIIGKQLFKLREVWHKTF